MAKTALLLTRLEQIGHSLEQTDHALALVGLGSVGEDLYRLDDYSDLDFFVIVQPGAKSEFLTQLRDAFVLLRRSFMMSRPIVVLVVVGALVACGQPAQAPSTTIQAPVRSPGVALASPRPQAPQPTSTVAVTAAPATTTPLSLTAASPLPTSATVIGTVTYSAQPTLPPDATLTVQLLELLPMDWPSVIGQQVIRSAGSGPISFVIAYDPTRIDPQREYVISANVHQQEQLLFITSWYPVLTQGHPATVEIVLQPPRVLRGTISYPARPALPPDAVLTIQLVNQSFGGIFGYPVLGKQIITPVGRGPTPFALAYNPATIDPHWTYAVEAWISAPGRLAWRAEQPSPVLTQGHPATVEVRVEPPPALAALSGTVTYPAQPTLPPDAVLAIQLVNSKHRADSEQALGAVSINPVGPGPIPFTLEYDPRRIDQQEQYVVYASLRVREKLSFITTTPYPVITQGHTTTVEVVLQAPATVSALSGTITYRAQRPLPPDAKLVIQVKDLGPVNGADYLPVLLGEQVIRSVGLGPIPFAIEYDPATIDPQRAYELDAKIYAGEKILFTTTAAQRVLVDGQPTPVEVMLESVK